MLRLPRAPRKITTQIILLVAASAIIFHICLTLVFAVSRTFAPRHDIMNIEDIADIINAVSLIPRDRRDLFIEKIKPTHPEIALFHAAAAPLVSGSSDSDLEARLKPLVAEDIAIIHRARGRIETRFSDGDVLISAAPHGPQVAPPLFHLLLPTLFFVMASVTLFLLWAVRNITQPLSDFVQAVDRFTLNHRAAPLPETGSIEVSVASRAFNRMQARIQDMIDDRTRMLASVGHDLRTPITRLRLRSEFIADDHIKNAMVQDLAHMDRMVHAALSYLRDVSATAPFVKVDLASLLQTICDDFDDMGHAITYVGMDHLIIDARSDDLRRAITNVVSNAAYFGRTICVSLDRGTGGMIDIKVSDDGPGIADCDKEIVFEPFERGAGLKESAGFGLGLSIVRAIVEAHSGTVQLLDRPEGGLICAIRLPEYQHGAGQSI